MTKAVERVALQGPTDQSVSSNSLLTTDSDLWQPEMVGTRWNVLRREEEGTKVGGMAKGTHVSELRDTREIAHRKTFRPNMPSVVLANVLSEGTRLSYRLGREAEPPLTISLHPRRFALVNL